MNGRKIITKNIKNIAHRGASALYPENTMAAFKGAVDMGADMIELDVRLSGDGIPVIFHNARLDAPLKATGLIADSTLDALKKLDAGSWFHPDFVSERIPTLEEVLAWASGTIMLNIELKTDDIDTGGRLEKACLSLVAKYRMMDQVLFSSFDVKAIQRVKELESAVSTALLFASRGFRRQKPSQLIERFGADVFHCTYKELTAKRLADLKEHQIPVTVYTVNVERRMKKLIAMDVSGIITDRPNILRGLLKKQNRNHG